MKPGSLASQQTPSQAFRILSFLHWAFIAPAFIYIIVAERVAFHNSPFDGFIEDISGSTLTLMRIGAFAWAIAAVTCANTLLASDTAVRLLTNRRAGEPGLPELLEALYLRHILRIAWIESAAIFGLTLFMIAGSRWDLYPLIGLALLGFVVSWPSRSRWTRTFRSLSKRYHDVPSDPWRDA